MADLVPVFVGSLEPRYEKLISKFQEIYGSSPKWVVRAPGRVNLIGEHVDYSGYPVLPMAISNDCLIAVTPQEQTCSLSNFESGFSSESFSTSIKSSEIGSHNWASYVKCGFLGVAETINNAEISGFKALVHGTVPKGGGLSSSSALVCASALATMIVNNLSYTKTQMADLCQKCERYVGTMGGGMDQAISFLGNPGTASLIAFNPLTTKNIPLPPEHVFFIANSLVESQKYETADTCFNMRVVECKLATKLLAAKLCPQQIDSIHKLIDVQNAMGCTLEQMKAHVKQIIKPEAYTINELAAALNFPVRIRDSHNEDSDSDFSFESLMCDRKKSFHCFARAFHVFHESSLVQQFAAAQSAKEQGDLMNQSHQSCRDNFDCSCPELNDLVSVCLKAGAIGSRLTGAGWGGCVVSLVHEKDSQQFYQTVKDQFYPKRDPNTLKDVFFETAPGQGAFVLSLRSE